MEYREVMTSFWDGQGTIYWNKVAVTQGSVVEFLLSTRAFMQYNVKIRFMFVNKQHCTSCFYSDFNPVD